MVDCLDEFYNAVLEQTGAREGDSNLYKGRKSQMMDDISFHQSDVKYGYVGKNRAIIYYSIYAEGDKFYGRLSKLLSIDLNSLQQTVLCNDSRDEGDIRIARFDMKNDVMWLQKIDEDRYGGDILYKHKIQPLKVITNITNCIDSWTLPNGWGRFIKDMYFDGKCVYYPNGSKILFGGNDGKYSEWNDNAPVSSSYFSILGPWVHINCDTYIGEDVNDYFIPNRVKMAGEDEWLIIKNNIH
jgi:hypothetical protein